MTPVLFLVGPAIVHLEECNAGIVNHDDRWLGNALVSETQKRVRTPTVGYQIKKASRRRWWRKIKGMEEGHVFSACLTENLQIQDMTGKAI